MIDTTIAPTGQGALDRLASAILETDPSAVILERTPTSTRLKISEPGAPETIAWLVETSSAPPAEALNQLRAELKAAVATVRSGQNLHIVVIDAHRLGVEASIQEFVPRSILKLDRHGHVWYPRGELKTVRGLSSVTLKRAVQRAPSGGLPSLEVTGAARAEAAREAQRFLDELKTRRPVVTWVVAVSTSLIFGLQLLWGGGDVNESALRMGAGLNALVSAGQVWRLLSVVVLHGGVAHLAMNMLALFGFGTFLEQYLGWRRYLILYVVSGLGGSLVSMLRPAQVMSVGASGGIWGLMIAGAVLVTWPRQRLPALLSASQRKRAWTPVVINAAVSLAPGIDWLAHLGGGMTGGLLVLSGAITAGFALSGAVDENRPPARENGTVRVLAALSGAALLGSVVMAWVNGRPWELQGRPRMTRVAIPDAGASIELPHLLGSSIDMGRHVWTFGAFRYDPVVFVFGLYADDLGDAAVADRKKSLKEQAEALNANPETLKEVTVTTPFELNDHQGTPYLQSRQATADGRIADLYRLIIGRRLVDVSIYTTNKTSAAWKSAAAEVPFSITLRPTDAPGAPH